MGGLLIAGLGVAAAAGLFFFLKSGDVPKTPQAQAPVATVTVTVTATAAEEVPDPEANAQAHQDSASEGEEDDGSLDVADLPDAEDDEASTGAVAAVPGPLDKPGAPAPVAQNDTAAKDPKEAFDGPTDRSRSELDEEMRKSAGELGAKEETPQPASQEAGPKNLPDKPPQGSISAFVAGARSRAKSCVAGADDQSVATVIFGSSGQVQRVAVSGWAAGKPAASCIDSAMKSGKVEPFTKSSYPVTVVVRP